jgi:hypothetical protein
VGVAEIISGGPDGLYTAQIVFDVGGASTAIAAIDAELAQIEEELELIEEEITQTEIKLASKKADCYDKSAAYVTLGEETLKVAEESLEQIKAAWEEITHGGSDGFSFSYSNNLGFGFPEVFDEEGLEEPLEEEDLPEIAYTLYSQKVTWNTAAGNKWSSTSGSSPTPVPNEGAAYDAYLEWMKCTIEQWALNMYLISVERFRDLRLFRQSSLELRKLQIQAAVANGESRSMWCTDLTEDLSGDVDTIEIDGAPTTILIGPGGVANITDDGGTPGYLSNIMAQTPAQTGLAWALLPGWQKWRPTYRVGTITAIDYEEDIASVTLDVATSAAQGLLINQEAALVSIPVEYMDCNAFAFSVGNRVVVEFTGQLWDGAQKVIGFETNPQPCEPISEEVDFGEESNSSRVWSGHGFQESPAKPELPGWYFGAGCHVASGETCVTGDCRLVIATASPPWASALGDSTYDICKVSCAPSCAPCEPAELDFGETVTADTTYTRSFDETISVSGEVFFTGYSVDIRHELSSASGYGCSSSSAFTYTGYENYSNPQQAAAVIDDPSIWIAMWTEYITEPYEYVYSSSPWVYPTPAGGSAGTLTGTVTESYECKYWVTIKAPGWDLEFEITTSDTWGYPSSGGDNVYVDQIFIYGPVDSPKFIFSWYDYRDGLDWWNHTNYTQVVAGVVTQLEGKPNNDFW